MKKDITFLQHIIKTYLWSRSQCRKLLFFSSSLLALFAFSIPMEVLNHFSDSMPHFRDGDVLALRQELDDMKTSLKEEKWYSTELKKEVEKLQVGLTDKAEKVSQKN